jgi:hypothetical protein
MTWQYLCHYDGWNKRFDTWLEIDGLQAVEQSAKGMPAKRTRVTGREGLEPTSKKSKKGGKKAAPIPSPFSVPRLRFVLCPRFLFPTFFAHAVDPRLLRRVLAVFLHLCCW